MIQIGQKIFNLSNQKITVLGAGISGIYAAALAGSFNVDVLLSDSQKINLTTDEKRLLEKNNVKIEENGQSEKIFTSDFIIKSPGIPNSCSIIQNLKKQNIPIIGEIEFAYQLLKTKKIIAITGSNGKTTTTSMIADFLTNTNNDVFCGGNIGNPLSKIVLEETISEKTIIVLELSSFQLEDISKFKPYISLFLNISEDHMDRYENNFNLYFQAKLKITQNQTNDDFYIYFGDDNYLGKNLPHNVKTIPYYLNNYNSEIYVKENCIFYNSINLININELNIRGTHNFLNLIAALNVCKILNLKSEEIVNSVKKFKAPEHRLEFVAEINGIKYYNDSKATNIDSVKMALTAFDDPIILILGGRDKDSNFTLLSNAIKEKVKILILTGESANKIESQLKKVIQPIIVPNFQNAIEKAINMATKNDIVLLSPACASFDAFKNYKERGQVFKKIVKGFMK